ncbi:hypothetical protein BJ123_13124 [Rhodopseudomonas thermotolerans]|uniref:Uncharacterized protein n=2 Tax=Rhodopseudomonas TaxID=1073 RepID=A0A336JUG1_9BRAD|nr:hypothetical protein BJ125_13124 [Rhodopseudomonas pentothenatexigens]REF90386.1 hypothetical protein BJ123_13124 [Rhodopseudomonas thermotolerans]SSW93168.1 hypothetical protein SAMN05892882_13124 [Rhodopseudomonas pentothenatexigens]
MNQRRNSQPADVLSKTPPLLVRVRNIVVRDGTLFVSFEGMNSWYAVPPHLETIIRQAAADRTALAITTTPNEVATAEQTSQEHGRC